jgi:hypothetical protein
MTYFSGMALRLANRRLRATRASFTKAEKKQLDAARYFTWDMDEDEFNGAEGFDVEDASTGKVVYQLWFFALGGGALYRNRSSEVVADIGEYGGAFKAVNPNPALREQFADAYARARKTFKLDQRITFPDDERETIPAPAKRGRPNSVGRQLAEWRRTPPETDEYFRAVIMDALGAPRWKRGDRRVFRPYPVRRWFELGAAAREALELLVDVAMAGVAPEELTCLGLPSDAGDLARFVGRGPLGPLDTPVTISGKPHPVWALVSDVVYRKCPVEDVVSLLKGLPEDTLASVWMTLTEMPSIGTGTHHLKTYFPTSEKEYAEGFPWGTPSSFDELFTQLLVAIAPRSRDGDAHTEAMIARYRNRKWARHTMLTSEHDEAKAALTTLRRLHVRAKARGGALAPEYDDLLATVMSATRDPLPLAYAILDDLPIERAGNIASGQLVLLARYPTLAGVKSAIGLLEKPDWWLEAPYYDKLFTKLVVKVGPDARPLLEAAIKRTFPNENKHMRKIMLARMKKALAELKKRTAQKRRS